MDFLSFICTADPTKVRVGKRQRAGGEPRLLETTIGRVVSLLPVAPARSSSDLEASVEKLFDLGGVFSKGTEAIAKDVAPLQPRRPKKRKTALVDSGEPSHPAKKLREDYGTPSGASIGGKSRSAVQQLLDGAIQNAEVRGEPVLTLPFVTSSISATPEGEDGGPTDPTVGLNLRTIGAPQRFVISSDSSHHSSANIAKAKVDSIARSSVSVMMAATTVTVTATPVVATKEKVVKPYFFSAESTSAGATDLVMGGFIDLTRSDILVGGIRTVVNPDSDIQKVYVPQWSVTNGSWLDDGRVCRDMVDEFAPP
ncbi:hypothetical protein Tco_1340719 [Tanacetum coccineum]